MTYRTVRRQPNFLGLCFVLALLPCMVARLDARASGKPLNKPSNPISLGPVTNIARPIQHGGHDKPVDWVFDIATSYLFWNDRSRVGSISSDSNSALIDFTAEDLNLPYTSFGLGYGYAETSGSSPTGTSQSANEHSVRVSVLQPLDELWSTSWKPLSRELRKTTENPDDVSEFHCQSSIIMSGNYGWAYSSLDAPRTTSLHGSANPFVGNALFDFQLAYFPERDKSIYYPNLFVEGMTGVQFATLRFGPAVRTSALTSVNEQVVYRDIVSVACSPFEYQLNRGYPFWNLLGFFASVELDNPLSVEPGHGSGPFYATTATFTGGLVFNYFSTKHIEGIPAPLAWSVSLLYSYLAFNPLTESNQLQVQFSYAF
jgi:hypothetical protein